MIRLKRLAQLAFHHSGALALLRHANRRTLRILMYHRFPAEHTHTFRLQCEHMVRHYRPISLTEAANHFKTGTALPENALAITIDDGYRDFYYNGYPSLKQFGIPATMFVTTGVIDGLTWFWWDKLHFALLATPLQSVSLAGEQNVPLRNAEEREAALHRIADAMTRVPNRERLALIDSLPALLQVEVPVSPPERFRPLGWAEIREMRSNGIEFGAHTVTHPILSRVESMEELRQEIEVSRDRVAEELGVPTRHFCYPSGRAEDLNAKVRQLAATAGFETAVTTEQGLNLPGADLLLMKRIGVEPECEDFYFARQVAGFRLNH